MKVPVSVSVLKPKQAREPVLDAIIDWIDRELGVVYGRQSGRGGNTLLELRRIFSGPSLPRAVPGFLGLLTKVEKTHYLLSYRIRTLLTSQFSARISDPLERSPEIIAPLPASLRALRDLRSRYFEHSKVIVPLNDIRIEFVPRTVTA